MFKAIAFIYISALLLCTAQASYFALTNYTDQYCQTLDSQKIFAAETCVESSDAISSYLLFTLTDATTVTRNNCNDEDCLDCNSTITYTIDTCGSGGSGGTLYSYLDEFPAVSDTTIVETDYDDRDCIGVVLFWRIYGTQKTCNSVTTNACTLDPDGVGSTWFNCAAMRNESTVPRGTTSTTGAAGTTTGNSTTGSTVAPTDTPSDAPTTTPTTAPTTSPTESPTSAPSTDAPTSSPTSASTDAPTSSPGDSSSTDGGQLTGSASSLSISMGLVFLASFFLLQ